MEEILTGIEEGIFSLNVPTGELGVLVYILQAWALYTIAQRRCISKPWLSWIPVVNVWILGSVSDQYQYVVKRQVKNKRKVLLGLNIAIVIAVVILIMVATFLFSALVMTGFSADLFSNGSIINDNFETIIGEILSEQINAGLTISLLVLSLLVLAIVQTVYFYMAMYDVFRSSDPKNSTLYLVLSLVGNFVVDGICCVFLMLCKDKDLGMPPRKPEPIPEIVEERDPWEKTEE